MWSASDVVKLAECEYGTRSRLDEVRGLAKRQAQEPDAMLERAGALGHAHERRVLEGFLQTIADATGKTTTEAAWTWTVGAPEALPPDVTLRLVKVEARTGDGPPSRADLESGARVTLEALRAGAPVVYQATILADGFVGHADFLVREDLAAGTYDADAGRGARYVVVDAKVARHVTASALLQIGCYGARLHDAGIPLVNEARVVLGTEEFATYPLGEVEAIAREAMDRFVALGTAHVSRVTPAAWGDDDIEICGRCIWCVDAINAHDDLLKVANLRRSQRTRLRAAGIRTVADLAEAGSGPKGMLRDAFESLRTQAGMQSGRIALVPDGGTVDFFKNGVDHSLNWKLIDRSRLDTLPPQNPGDIYFDFEGDPLWKCPVTGEWGIDYLFGLVTRSTTEQAKPPFTRFWAHSFAEEKRALQDFIAYVQQRREQFPDLHVYHYAAYEKTHLLSIAARHGVCEDQVDRLLRDGVFVDLYPVVRGSICISADSYSLKRLEPLYMGEDLRIGDVTDAATSITVYADYCAAADSGDTLVDGRPAADVARALLESIADYNNYDCRSTLELDSWLRERAASSSLPNSAAADPGVEQSDEGSADKPEPHDDGGDVKTEPAVVTAIREEVDAHDAVHGVAARTPDVVALAMLGAAAGFSDREAKTYWQDIISHLQAPLEEWPDSREHIPLIDAREHERWHDATKGLTGKTLTRVLCILTDLPAGAKLDSIKAMYPGTTDARQTWLPGLAEHRLGGSLTVDTARTEAEGNLTVLYVKETCAIANAPEGWSDTPTALLPGTPPPAGILQESVIKVAEHSLAAYQSTGSCGSSAALSMLRRARTTMPAAVDDDWCSAIAGALAAGDSCVAVQGPPGTGKTYTGSRVIARFLAQGWRIGVVAQSHTTVENLLERICALDAVDSKKQVFKVGGPKKTEPWTWVRSTDDLPGGGGIVVGGTAWLFAKLGTGELDLLVVDEAGQYSLAFTIAAGRAAKRLLLLGDPQQLGQVSQASHPEHVDESALSWVAEEGLVPPDRGYLLDKTYRMHPEVTGPISRLSYRGLLHAADGTSDRSLEGIDPGVETVLIPHSGNTTSSLEEADEVVRQVQRVIGLTWRDGHNSRDLDQSDVLVVAPFNAQVGLVSKRLAEAGYPDVEVGTVDRFQGREAPVAILTTATSSAADSPRGLDFVIERNRTNVAVSRAQWLAVIVRSERLTAAVPNTPDGLVQLGAFVRLCNEARKAKTPSA